MSTENTKNNSEKNSDLKTVNAKTVKLKWILLAVFAGLVIIGLSISTTMLLIRSKEAVSANKPQLSEQANQKSKKDTSFKKFSSTPLFYNLRPVFVVNIPSKSRIRLLQIEVDIMSRNTKVIDSLKLYEPLIKSELVNLFSSKEYEILVTAEGKEILRNEAFSKIKNILKEQAGVEGVEQVLFTSFVTQ